MADNCLDNKDVKCMIEDIINLLGGGIRKIDIPDSTWCSLIRIATQDYAAYLQDWLTRNQWTGLANQNLTTTDICFALTTRSYDFVTQFSYAYSKQVGLQARGNFELKKDFIQLEPNKQVYEIPAGRELNEVLWLNDSTTNLALTTASGDIAWNFLGMGYYGGGNIEYDATAPYYIAPAYDTVLRAADYKLKNRLLRSDFYYKITAGANGTRLIHLIGGDSSPFRLNTPCGGCNSCSACSKIAGCRVWYHYYDTGSMTEDEANKCKDECKDIIKVPSEIPFEEINYCDMNLPTRTFIRRYLTALAKETLGKVYGRFNGKIGVPDAELSINFESFEAEGKEEKVALLEELKEKLAELNNETLLERAANEAEYINRALSKRPNGIFVI